MEHLKQFCSFTLVRTASLSRCLLRELPLSVTFSLARSLACSLAPSLPRSLAPSLPRSLAPSLALSVDLCTLGEKLHPTTTIPARQRVESLPKPCVHVRQYVFWVKSNALMR